MTETSGDRKTVTHDCPLCPDDYEKRSDLRIHLEVEHRKSELARGLLEEHDAESDPTVDAVGPEPVASTTYD